MASLDEISLCELDLRFFFVTATGQQHEEHTDLNSCFERIAERFDTNECYSWISDADAARLASADGPPLTRKTIFVFAQFSGTAFDRVRKSHAVVLGPKCIIDCFVNDTNIPNIPSPVFNVALRDRHICTSGLKTVDKQRVQRLVQYMGGYFHQTDLSANTTYLVTNTTMSVKYEKAVTNGIRAVTPDWVDELWTLSTTGDCAVLDATVEAALYDRHRIPMFHRLGITSTGIGTTERGELKTLIEQHGGIYLGSFKSELIDILIARPTHVDSDKFRAAIKCRKTCLTPDWFTDSVTRGYALPIEEYRIVSPAQTAAKLSASTPTKLSAAPNESRVFNANCTNLSEIMGNVSVNESRVSVPTKRRNDSLAADNPHKVLLANINPQVAKKSGAFLDGCNVLLCGFSADEREKLSKILTNACAVQFDEYDSRVEYVLVGQPSSADLQQLNTMNSRALVTLHWLVASIEQKSPAPERAHAYALPVISRKATGGADSCASPASKKNMASMSNSFRRPAPRRLEMDEQQAQMEANAESEFLQQYLVAPAPQPFPEEPKRTEAAKPAAPRSSDVAGKPSAVEPIPVADRMNQSNATVDDDEDDDPEYFAGLTFFVDGFTSESEENLVSIIESAGGKNVSSRFRGTVDYCVVPMDIFQPNDVQMKSKHLVNEFWVMDTSLEKALIGIEYYHRPFEWNDESHTPLSGMTLVLTTYSGNERTFLAEISRIMGADVQERYAKTKAPVLICPRPEGAKYNGAIKWGLPVVSCDWVLKCAAQARKVGMRPFLVGASVAPADEPEDAPDDNSLAANEPLQPVMTNTGTDSLQLSIDGHNEESMQAAVVPAGTSLPLSSIDRLKRQRPDDFSGGNSNAVTPVLKHRRLSEIAHKTPARKDSLCPSQSTPQSVDYAANLKSRLEDLATPVRETVYRELIKLKESETPETRRRCEAVSTPDLLRSPISAEFRTPAREQRLRANANQHYIGPVPSPAPTTPFAEIQRRFWKKALGDNYVSPSQQAIPVTQTQSACKDDSNDSRRASNASFSILSAVPDACSTQLPVEQENVPAVPARAQHVKRLSDFIQKQKSNERTPTKPAVVPPVESQMLAHPMASVANSEPQSDVVVWRDPDEFHAEQNPYRGPQKMQYAGTPKFNISCMDAQRLELITASIVRLGGEICANLGGYDPSCTHVLCEKPSRSEKIFSAIAAGKWLLSLRYAEDSALADGFLNEESYEFGNPMSGETMPDSLSDETGRAAYRWRRQLQAIRKRRGDADDPSSIGVFSAFRVILHTQASKKSSFKNLLEAGGGQVLDVTEPYESSKEALTATHCVLDSRNKLNAADRKALELAGVVCVNILFLQAYVSSETEPNPKDFGA